MLEIEHGAPAARVRVNAGVMLRTPGLDEDLAAGLLYSEGFIRSMRAIDRFETPSPGHLRVHLAAGVALDQRLARRMLARASACGLCGRDAIDDLAGIGGQSLPGGPHVTTAVL